MDQEDLLIYNPRKLIQFDVSYLPDVQELYRQVKDETFFWYNNITKLLKELASFHDGLGPFSTKSRSLAAASDKVFKDTEYLRNLYDQLIDLCEEYCDKIPGQRWGPKELNIRSRRAGK